MDQLRALGHPNLARGVPPAPAISVRVSAAPRASVGGWRSCAWDRHGPAGPEDGPAGPEDGPADPEDGPAGRGGLRQVGTDQLDLRMDQLGRQWRLATPCFMAHLKTSCRGWASPRRSMVGRTSSPWSVCWAALVEQPTATSSRGEKESGSGPVSKKKKMLKAPATEPRVFSRGGARWAPGGGRGSRRSGQAAGVGGRGGPCARTCRA